MAEQILAVFDARLRETMHRLAAAAESQQLHLYLVGGAVRDCLLGLASSDIDFVVEGEAIAFARHLEKSWDSLSTGLLPPQKVVTFPRYGTAKLIFPVPIAPGIEGLDFASARSERYPASGAAPQVTFPASLEQDLGRRDFSVNAMAVGLSGDGGERLVDLHHGAEDLGAKTLRVLHPLSFVDDPARLLRAVRFEVRFGFAFDDSTRKLFHEGVEGRFITRLPRPRLLDEFRKILEEKDLRPILSRLEECGLLRQIHPQMTLPDFSRPLASAWQVRLRCVLGGVSEAEFQRILVDFGLSQRQALDIVEKSRGWKL